MARLTNIKKNHYVISYIAEHPVIVAGFLGVLLSFAFAPFDFFWIPWIVFPFFLQLLSVVQHKKPGYWPTFRIVLALIYGQFLFGFYWISNALWVDIESFWWLWPIALFGLPMLIAMLQVPVVATIAWMPQQTWPRIFSFALVWLVSEWCRGHLLTGFPWNIMGYVWNVDDGLIQIQSILGAYGSGFWLVLLACIPWCLFQSSRQKNGYKRKVLPILLMFVAVFLQKAWGDWRASNNPQAFYDSFSLRLVQPNIDQKLKWNQESLFNNIQNLVELSRSNLPNDASLKSPMVVIWPEAAASFYFDFHPEWVEMITQAIPENGFLITGTMRAERHDPKQRWNSLVNMNAAGKLVGSYNKFHLVPFGEYVPMAKWFDSYLRIVPGATGFSAGDGPQAIGFQTENLIIPEFSPLICYEVIFPGSVRPDPVKKSDVGQKSNVEWFVNVTNDAWYGTSPGPFQHLEIARSRAVEHGIPLVRVANTGISAIIDPLGRIVAEIPLNQRGFLDSRLPKKLPNGTFFDHLLLFNGLLMGGVGGLWLLLMGMTMIRKKRSL